MTVASPASMTSREVGQQMESAACTYLARRGCELIERNYRTKGGEIDLIMSDAETLVFVEVRYRANATHGQPIDSITAGKRRRVLHAARSYLMRFRVQPSCRFDVVAIAGTLAEPQINWIKAAFDATGGSWSP